VRFRIAIAHRYVMDGKREKVGGIKNMKQLLDKERRNIKVTLPLPAFAYNYVETLEISHRENTVHE